MKRMQNMKNSDIMEKLYVGMDIHEKYITGTAMRKDGIRDLVHGHVPYNP
jgi:hypothetical protein